LTKSLKPSAALLKAALVNSARPLTSTFTLLQPDSSHGDCQPTSVDYYSDFPTGNDLCQYKYADSASTCTDISGFFTQQNGDSVFCQFDGAASQGGCDHILECCTCKQIDFEITSSSNLNDYLCDPEACLENGIHYRRHLLSDSRDNKTMSNSKFSKKKPFKPFANSKEHDKEMTEGEHVVLGSDPKHVNIYGHGQIELDNTMMFEGSNLVIHVVDDMEGLNTGDVHEFTIQLDSVPETIGFFRASLVWTDPPALPTTAHGRSLVNDLDLEVEYDYVIEIGNSMYNLPTDVLDESGRDRVNNVEVVHVENPQVGTYVLRVKGFMVPMPSQRYALVVNYLQGDDVLCTSELPKMTSTQESSPTNPDYVPTNAPTQSRSPALAITATPTQFQNVTGTLSNSMKFHLLKGSNIYVFIVGLILQWIFNRE